MKNINEAFLATLEMIGLKELPGNVDNPIILEMYKELGHGWVKHDEVAWCAALFGSMLKKFNYKIPVLEKRLAARGYLTVNRPLMAPVEIPEIGIDYVVFKRDNNSYSGHVAWFISFDGEFVKVLGGNQSNKISIASFHKSEVLNYMRPEKNDTE
ncbi:MAG: hypothetical protein HQ522_16160 [Bacteroidetes bacterium]|nr:hypothetical protein [Bacteroidota bacterium]